MRSLFASRLVAAASLAVLSVVATGCGIDKAVAPPVSGPSGFSLVLTLVAIPDILPRDGHSTALVRLTARNADGQAAAGQRLILAVSGGGTLSATDVTTDAAGNAAVEYTAPSLATPSRTATIAVTPIVDLGTVTSATRTLIIGLAGPSVPSAAFAFLPETPGAQELVTFNASGTTLDGRACGGDCHYAWSFSDGGSTEGQIATHRFGARGTYTVRLTVTGPGNVVVSTTQTVTVGAPATLTAAFSFSPTNPRTGDTVHFNATSSVAPDGTPITSYAWDFGNGTTGDGPTTSIAFSAARTYVVRLTVTDAHGRTGTTTMSVPVTEPTP